ncbi:hypothetical protein Cyagr_2495 [Cyanobium gracile PCC 6307]|uniref:Uncharacterized protein n=1 Tax=Cyanobium gracile (strain ATCC 27147 / PCC 6307) TaxID=292564 RepID=K9PA37_CYAGP|nr:hypothetical protein Cyagr_2495 [Cyanobium gracile PCC 6307]
MALQLVRQRLRRDRQMLRAMAGGFDDHRSYTIRGEQSDPFTVRLDL